MVNDYFIRSFVLTIARIHYTLVAWTMLSLGLDKALADIPPIISAVSNLRQLSDALDAFHSVHRRYPTQTEGLAALEKQPETVTDGRWDQLLRALPKDPWGRDFVYVYPGVQHPDKYDLYSLGRGGISITGGNDRDDIDGWNYDRAFFYYRDIDERPPRIPKEVTVYRAALGSIIGICVGIALIRVMRRFSVERKMSIVKYHPSQKLSNEHPA